MTEKRKLPPEPRLGTEMWLQAIYDRLGDIAELLSAGLKKSDLKTVELSEPLKQQADGDDESSESPKSTTRGRTTKAK